MREAPQVPSDLIRRLPGSFGPALRNQFRQWDLLFAAERRQLQAQMAWLSQLPEEEFKGLFASLFRIESRMDLPRPDASANGLSVRDAGILARSPLYPQWRAEVERIFSRIDTSAQALVQSPTLERLLVCVLPSGIPLGDQAPWQDLAGDGAWVRLDRAFGEILRPLASAVANRACTAAVDADERTWVFDGDSRLAELSGGHVFCWRDLDALRRDFLRRLNALRRDLRAVDEVGEQLRRADLRPLIPAALADSPRVREFVRTLLLSGNGSLVFANSFVEWGASEALRRAQPHALIASFTIRPKLKPFSSLALFEDQNRSNPVPDEPDPAGSMLDTLMLSRYVYLAAQRVACYPGHTLTLLAAWDSSRVLAIGPRIPPSPLSAESLIAFVLQWLG